MIPGLKDPNGMPMSPKKMNAVDLLPPALHPSMRTRYFSGSYESNLLLSKEHKDIQAGEHTNYQTDRHTIRHSS